MCEAAGKGKAAVQGTAMASGACCGVTRLMRRWGDMRASGAPLIKIHCIHWQCGTIRARTHRHTEQQLKFSEKREGKKIKM